MNEYVGSMWGENKKKWRRTGDFRRPTHGEYYEVYDVQMRDGKLVCYADIEREWSYGTSEAGACWILEEIYG